MQRWSMYACVGFGALIALAACGRAERLVQTAAVGSGGGTQAQATVGGGNTPAFSGFGPGPASANLPVSRLIGGATLDPDTFWPPTGVDCATALTPQGTVPTQAPQAYLDACAGCHGPVGEGHGIYPGIVGARDYNTFATVVRQGKQGAAGEMPFFPTTWLNDDDMRRIYAYLTASPLQELGTCQTVAPMSDANIQAAMTAGLATWRTQDGKQDPNGIVTNVACVQCHAPDPLDIAYYGYTDGDILRRGIEHLPAAQVANVVEMVHALRQTYKLGRRIPLQARPFQPGGGLLEGNSIPERDAAFGTELAQLNLRVMQAPINSAADANAAMNELWNLDRHTLRIPVPFDHYTEDAFHNPTGYVSNCLADIDGCSDHGSIADWLPVAPHIPTSFPALYATMDAYLQSPNDTTFNQLRGALPGGDTMPGTYAYATRDLDDGKYRSLLMANYCLQLEVRGLPGCYDRGVTPFPNEADMWTVGTNINLYGTGYENYNDCDANWMSCAQAPANLTLWPAHLLNDITPHATLSSNFSRLRHTWMTMWWVHFDPTLLVTGDPTAQKDEYFTRSLLWSNDNDWQFDGTPQSEANPTYAIFTTYEVLMHNIATLKNPQLASCSVYPATDFPCTQVDVRSGFYPDVINFAEGNQPQTAEADNNVHYQTRFQPTDAARRANYQMLVGNMYRMFLWQLIGALQQDPWICEPALQQLRIVRAQEFIQQAETQTNNAAADAQMFSTLATLLQAAPTQCPAQ